MTPDDLDKHVDTFELINAEMAGSHDRQSDALDKVDGKVVVLIGYVVGAGAFLATRHAQPVLEVLAYVAFIVALGFGVAAWRVRGHEDIDPATLFMKYAPLSKAQTLVALAIRRKEHWQFNERLLAQKANYWTVCVSALLAGAALMIIAIVVQTYDHDHTTRQRPRPAATSPARCIPAEPCGMDVGGPHQVVR
jgi:hypothetical protein